MVLTEEQKERRRITAKKYYEKNKEKIKETQKKYRETNREYFTEYDKKYREDNNNREKIKERMKIYTKTPQGIKSGIISSWKQHGLIYEDYDSLYGHYLNANNCDECGIKFGKFGGGVGDWKCMDHDHETGAFRNFLCHKCNLRRH